MGINVCHQHKCSRSTNVLNILQLNQIRRFGVRCIFIISTDPDDGVKTSLRNASLLLQLRHKILYQNILFASSSLLRALDLGNQDATVLRNVGKSQIQNDFNTNQQHPEDLTSNAKGLSGCEVVSFG